MKLLISLLLCFVCGSLSVSTNVNIDFSFDFDINVYRMLVPFKQDARNGNMEEIQRLYQNASGQIRDILLMIGAWDGNIEVVKFLVDKGHPTNDKNTCETALMAAARCGHVDIVNILIETQSGKHSSDTGDTALM